MDAEVEIGLRARRHQHQADDDTSTNRRDDDDDDADDDDWFDLGLGWNIDSAINAVTSEASKIMESAATYDILSALQEAPTADGTEAHTETHYQDSDFFYHIPVPTPSAAMTVAKNDDDEEGGGIADINTRDNDKESFFYSPDRSSSHNRRHNDEGAQQSMESPWDWGSPAADRLQGRARKEEEDINHGSLLLLSPSGTQYTYIDSHTNSGGRPVYVSDGRRSDDHAVSSSNSSANHLNIKREKQVDFFGFEIIADGGGGEVASVLLNGLLGPQSREQPSASIGAPSSSSSTHFGVGSTAMSTVNSAVSSAMSFFDNIDEEIDLSQDAILRQIKLNKERVHASIPAAYAAFIPSLFATQGSPEISRYPSPARSYPVTPISRGATDGTAPGAQDSTGGGAQQSTVYFVAIRLLKTAIFLTQRIALFAVWLLKEVGIICLSSMAVSSSERSSYTIFSASDVTRDQRVRRVLLYLFSRLTHTYGIMSMGLLLLLYSFAKFSKIDPMG